MNTQAQGTRRGSDLLLGAFIAILSSVCTVGISTAGNYWLEIRKARIQIQKEAQLSTLHTLESVSSQLQRLNAEVQYVDSLTNQSANGRSKLLYHAGFTAGIMAEIEEKRTALPLQSSAYVEISVLLDGLAPQLASIQGGAPKAPGSFDHFFDMVYKQQFRKATDAVQHDQAKILSTPDSTLLH